VKYFIFAAWFLFTGWPAVGFSCEPSVYFLFGEAARERLHRIHPDQLAEKIILLINLAAYNRDEEAGRQACELYEDLSSVDRTPLMRAYGGALKAIQLRDRAFYSKAWTYVFSGGMSEFRQEMQCALDSISQSFAEVPDSDLIRFIRVAIGAEAIQKLPDPAFFKVVSADLEFLEQTVDSTDYPRMFFINLFWVKYYCALAKHEKDQQLLEKADTRLNLAYVYACTPFCVDETRFWFGRVWEV